jgi:hypothetical protein
MKTGKERKFDLEERLIDYAILISDLIEQLPNSKLCNHIGGQLIRSGTSPALNYGEAQSAESIGVHYSIFGVHYSIFGVHYLKL